MSSACSSHASTGRSLEEALIDRVLGPLGMDDTRFSVSPRSLDRFGATFGTDPSSGERWTFDEADGQWSRPPAFSSGGGGLVSTIDDYLAFARMLRAGGATTAADRPDRAGGGDDLEPAHPGAARRQRDRCLG